MFELIWFWYLTMYSTQLPMLAIIFHLSTSSMAYCFLEEEVNLDHAFLQDWIFQLLILLEYFNILEFHCSYSIHFQIEQFCMFIQSCFIFLALFIWKHCIKNIRHHILFIIICIDISCFLLRFSCLLIIVQLIVARTDCSIR